MKLCIPTSSNRALEAALPPDFADATHLMVVDTDSGQVVANQEVPARRVWGSGARERVDIALALGAEGVLCRSIGQGARSWFAGAHLPVFLTEASVAGEALGEYKAGGEHRLATEGPFQRGRRFAGRGFGGGRGFGFGGGRGRGRGRGCAD
jgi:predicted Fe-Mo cluster-binding NifX family protein